MLCDLERNARTGGLAAETWAAIDSALRTEMADLLERHERRREAAQLRSSPFLTGHTRPRAVRVLQQLRKVRSETHDDELRMAAALKPAMLALGRAVSAEERLAAWTHGRDCHVPNVTRPGPDVLRQQTARTVAEALAELTQWAASSQVAG